MRSRIGVVAGLAVAMLFSGLTWAAAQEAGPARVAGARGYAASGLTAPDVQVNRGDLISEALRTWSVEPGQSPEQLRIALRRASDEQLTRVVAASSFNEVNSILLGPQPNALGSTTGDYVYTAVTPCRIIDTRNVGGPIAAGATRDFYVYGTLDALQGGDPAGCGSPRGEPRAVHINLTAIPLTPTPAGPGNLRVYPANVTTPLVSAVNFQANNIANALVVQTYYSIGPREIQIFASNTTNVVADVMGYFYDADLTLASGKTTLGVWTATGYGGGAGGDVWGTFAFPFRLASAPTPNYIAPGGASTTNCPGTSSSPSAAAGQLCVYARNCSNATFQCIFRGSTGTCSTADPYGAGVWITSTAAGDAWCYGTWAVTAP